MRVRPQGAASCSPSTEDQVADSGAGAADASIGSLDRFDRGRNSPLTRHRPLWETEDLRRPHGSIVPTDDTNADRCEVRVQDVLAMAIGAHPTDVELV